VSLWSFSLILKRSNERKKCALRFVSVSYMYSVTTRRIIVLLWQARQVEGQRSDKIAAQLLFLLLSYFSHLYFPFILRFLFLLFLWFSRPYITFLRCSDVKPLSLTPFVTFITSDSSNRGDILVPLKYYFITRWGLLQQELI